MNISINNIEFSYNGSPVLKDISCHIDSGDFVTLVGPNGSGKSTLIKCITGILKPQKGSVKLKDNSANDSIIHAHELAYVPQNENRSTGLTVFDTVLLGRKPYINWRPSETDLKITAWVIESLHLDDVVMKPINKLSGGQQQTVFIARALAQEPRVLLLDEPTANLDLKHQIEVLEVLKKLSDQGITIILALHDINLALRYAQKIMMLKNGSIVGFGGLEIIQEKQMTDLYDIDVKIIKNEYGTFIVPYGLQGEDPLMQN